MIGFRIFPRAAVVPADLVEAFRPIPVANVSDVMSRTAGAGAQLRPWHAGAKLCGVALTVRTRPGDNLMIHKALDLAQPGDVIVVDGDGDLNNALMGELMMALAIKRGVAGLVLNGAVRDLDWIRRSDLPVYAVGVTHRGPYKEGPGEINTSISIGGMVVAPGDLMLGDADGVVCVPKAEAVEICEAARAKSAAEGRQMNSILDGTIDRSWIDAELARRKCVAINEPQTR
ncbi:MAG: RraA family protein [Salinarimonadaceae bacterium]|nr:MAG: RraA family protein [Salinarimonadaceae bacterium]